MRFEFISIKLLTFIILSVFYLSCNAWRSTFKLQNQTSTILKQVVVSGTGFEISIGDVLPGESVERQVCPTGESSLILAFEANGKQIKSDQNTYFECNGYYVLVDVANDLSVSTKVELK